MSRPESFKIGREILVRAVRPRGKRGPADGRWFLRADQGRGRDRRTIWSGYAHPHEAETAVLDVLQNGPKHPKRAPIEDAAPTARAIHDVGDLMAVWVGSLEDRQEAGRVTAKTVTGWRDRAKQVKAVLGTTPLQRLGFADLDRFANERLRTAAPSTVRREVKAIFAAWRYGQAVGVVPARALPKLSELGIPDRPVRERHTPDAADVEKVIAELDGWPRMAVILLDATGCRVSEIATLTRDRVDLAGGVVHVLAKRKPGQDPAIRSVPIADDVVESLRTWLADTDCDPDGLVLGTTPHMVRSQLSTPILRDACKAAKVKHRFTPHGLRRAAVDRMARAGVDVGAAASVLGHSPAVALQNYRQVSADDRRAAIDAAGLGRRANDETPVSEESAHNLAHTSRKRGFDADSGTPKGNRTPVFGVRGRRPNR